MNELAKAEIKEMVYAAVAKAAKEESLIEKLASKFDQYLARRIDSCLDLTVDDFAQQMIERNAECISDFNAYKKDKRMFIATRGLEKEFAEFVEQKSTYERAANKLNAELSRHDLGIKALLELKIGEYSRDEIMCAILKSGVVHPHRIIIVANTLWCRAKRGTTTLDEALNLYHFTVGYVGKAFNPYDLRPAETTPPSRPTPPAPDDPSSMTH